MLLLLLMLLIWWVLALAYRKALVRNRKKMRNKFKKVNGTDSSYCTTMAPDSQTGKLEKLD